MRTTSRTRINLNSRSFGYAGHAKAQAKARRPWVGVPIAEKRGRRFEALQSCLGPGRLNPDLQLLIAGRRSRNRGQDQEHLGNKM